MNSFFRKLVIKAIVAAKRAWYGHRGEPIQYGPHLLRYVPGTRPVRLKHANSPDFIVRNDVKQTLFVIERVRPGEFVLDIGGNVGQYAILFGALVNASGKVITFEPDAKQRQLLIENVQLNKFTERIVVEEFALCDTNGTHKFFSRDDDQMCSLARSGLGTNAESPDVKEQIVRTMRLDDYLTMHKLGFPDWVKLDAEGAEISILRGAQNLLRSAATIICELHPYAWGEFDSSYEELLTMIRESGKNIRYLDESLRIEDGPLHGAVIIS
jgi:FkbM family methyltransferase